MIPAIVLGFAATFAPATTSHTICGGAHGAIGMTMGLYLAAGKPHAQSLVSLAAIYDRQDNISGWWGLDNRGFPWVEFSGQPSGDRLRRVLLHQLLPIGGDGVFRELESGTAVPEGYALRECASATKVP